MARNYHGQHSSTLSPPPFSNEIEKSLDYCQVRKIGNIYNAGRKIDAIQINITSPTFNLSIGNVGFYLKSPSGMVSVLQTPNNIFKDFNYTLGAEDDFVLSTYAYYGETGSGPWEIFTVSTDPDGNCGSGTDTQIRVSSRIINLQ
jgi:hypothetical protein